MKLMLDDQITLEGTIEEFVEFFDDPLKIPKLKPFDEINIHRVVLKKPKKPCHHKRTKDRFNANLRWTQKEILNLVQFYKNGFSVDEIAKKLGRTPQAIHATLCKASKAGIVQIQKRLQTRNRKKATKKRSRANTPWTNDEKIAAVGMNTQCKSRKEIARTLGRTPKAVQVFLYANKLTATQMKEKLEC